MSRVQLVSLAGLLGLAAVFGLWMGLRAVPPGETEIITSVAVQYAAETGGVPTDCYARPSALPGVRLVVICNGATLETAWVRAVDTYGAEVPVDLTSFLQEPST